MKFGVREICDVVFKAKSDVKIGNRIFKKGQPVLYIDTAKTSTVEGAATTVYATGGKGNTRLIAWEGEKTLTFTVEDALLSPMGFAVLSGAGLLKGKDEEVVHVHTTSVAYSSTNEIDLTDALAANEKICATAPIFAVVAEEDGSITGELIEGLAVDDTGKKLVGTIEAGKTLFVDFYIQKASSTVSELQIDAENFAGYYYVEASTLFRRQNDGVDMPAELTLPNVKIQSNFTFTMASTGDPSTFTFTMDAFPGYTYFNPTRKVLCAIQIIEDTMAGAKNVETVFPCEEDEKISESEQDSVTVAKVANYSAINYGGLGKAVNEMIENGAYVDNNGHVVATLKPVDEFTGFNSTTVSEQSGYYFPFEINMPGAKTMSFEKTTVANGAYISSKSNIPYDNQIILRIADADATQAIYDFKITSDNGKVAELHFDKVKFIEG